MTITLQGQGRFVAPRFGRELRADELLDYRKTVEKGLQTLGIKTLAVIMPATAFPSDPAEDIGIGSPLSKGGQAFSDWLGQLGFNAIQFLPNGQISAHDPSPYMSDSFSGNTLLIALQELTTPQWGKLLSQQTLDNITNYRPKQVTITHPERYGPGHIPSKTTTLVGDHIIDYGYVRTQSNRALKEAYEALKARQDDPTVRPIQQAFQAFINNPHTRYWLTNDSLYDALSQFYQSDRPNRWGQSGHTDSAFTISPQPFIDQHLFDRRHVSASQYQERLKAFEADPAFKVAQELYQFKQFVLHQQTKQQQAASKQHGQQIAQALGQPQWDKRLTINTMGDAGISPSARDTWTHPEAFMTGWQLHCPPDSYWGFPVLDFKKMVDKSGTLGEAGRFVYERFLKLFTDNPGGGRVDHATGVIDPWVAPTGKSHQEARRLRSSPEDPELKSNSVIALDQIEPSKAKNDARRYRCVTDAQIAAYSAPIQKTILQAAKDVNLPKDKVMFEQFDYHSPVPQRVMEQNQLSTIALTRHRNNGIQANDWATTGNHDFKGLQEWATDLYQGNPNIKQAEVNQLSQHSQLSPQQQQALATDPKQFVDQQWVKLFTTPAQHLQVMFMDVLGRDDRYHYNQRPDPINWRLRLTPKAKADYHQALINGKGLNLPKVLHDALALKNPSALAQDNNLNEQLLHFAKVLKSPETAG
jgi:4-alpha-glucanotransferase